MHLIMNAIAKYKWIFGFERFEQMILILNSYGGVLTQS